MAKGNRRIGRERGKRGSMDGVHLQARAVYMSLSSPARCMDPSCPSSLPIHLPLISPLSALLSCGAARSLLPIGPASLLADREDTGEASHLS